MGFRRASASPALAVSNHGLSFSSRAFQGRADALRICSGFDGAGPAPVGRAGTHPGRVSAGGVSDSIARALAERAAKQLGVPVIVENRGGAGGVVAMESLKREPPDGRTLVFSAISPLTLAPLFRPTGFDPDRDVTPVMSVMITPVLVVGTRALAGDTLAAAISAAKANPGGIRWATSGVGTTGHLVLQRVQASGAVDITHVPYRGGCPQLSDALAGEFEVLSSNVGEIQLSTCGRGA